MPGAGAGVVTGAGACVVVFDVVGDGVTAAGAFVGDVTAMVGASVDVVTAVVGVDVGLASAELDGVDVVPGVAVGAAASVIGSFAVAPGVGVAGLDAGECRRACFELACLDVTCVDVACFDHPATGAAPSETVPFGSLRANAPACPTPSAVPVMTRASASTISASTGGLRRRTLDLGR